MFLAIAAAAARADVAPPVAIKMPRATAKATSGVPYAGTFEIHVFEEGELADFRLEGEGWTITSFDPPADPMRAEVGTITLPFRAVPGDANQPIRLSLTYNGRHVAKAYTLGPKYFDRVGRARPLTSVGVRLQQRPVEEPLQDASGSQTTTAGGAVSLQFTGRLVYTRPDGRIVGADHILVQVMDDDGLASDPLVDEVIWEHHTDADGYFDSGVISWDDCDVVGCDEPDIYVYFECDMPVGQVQDPGVMEEDYFWDTMDNIHEDFTGSKIHFGTMTPSDPAEMPALHIWNTLVRAHRFIEHVTNIDVDHVDIQWPETGISTSQYSEFFDEIYITAAAQWNEGTVAHEYGHHFLANHSVTTASDYCNGFCDGDAPCTSGTDCEDEGHCHWCPETDHDSWNEGFPNWFGYVIPTSFEADYQFDDCTPYKVVEAYDFETVDTCCQDGQSHDPWLTEGFTAALLRDMTDERDDAHDPDDNDNESWSDTTDCMALGPEEILAVATVDQPTTPAGFFSSFMSRYPQHTPALWKTATNVHPSYASAFPADTAPPGPVTVLDSPTHPLGVGGALPCITVEFEQPSDDVTGAKGFSIDFPDDPGGTVPIEDVNWPGYCVSRATSVPKNFGSYYVSIRAVDNEDHWGPAETFGPFVINVDCNSNGIIDLCDIECDATQHALDAGLPCQVPSYFCDVAGCGMDEDCNFNLVPDACDLAAGTSRDCDRDGIPDECASAAGTLIQWADGNGSWHTPANWYKLSECPDPAPPPTCESPFQSDCPATPAPFDNVCIHNAVEDITVSYTGGDTDVDVLGCYESLSISGGSAATLRLAQPSWIDGELGLSGNNSVLEVNDRLDIAGLFTFTGDGRLKGPGTTYAHGGLYTSGIIFLEDHHLVLDGNSTSVGTGRVEFNGASLFEIRPGSSYEHQGGRYFLNGWFDDRFVNAGTLIKSTDPGESVIYMFTENSGLIHVTSGSLKFYLGGSSSGQFLADPGTRLIFTGGHDFLAGSSIEADHPLFSAGISQPNYVRGTYNARNATTVQDGNYVGFTNEATIVSYGASFFIPRGGVDFNAIVGDTIHFDTFELGGGYYGGTATFNSGDPVEFTNLTFGPGTIAGSSDIRITGLLTWNASGGFSGPGTVYADGDVVIGPGGGEKWLRDCTFNNAGTATFLGAFSLSSGTVVVNNLATGVMDIQVDGGAISGLRQTFNNAGLVVKSAGTGETTIQTPTTNTGTIEVRSGVLKFYTYYNGYYTQTAGQTVLNGGNVLMFGPAPLRIEGGVLTGAGTITGNVAIAGGTTAPGLSAGVLHVAGNYTQNAASSLEIEIDGLTEGSEYDQVTATGTASLAGTLEVLFPDSGFAPLPGDRYRILTAGNVTGTFDPVYVTNLSPQLNMDVVYTTTDVTLELSSLVPGDCDLDGDTDLAECATLTTCLSGPGAAFTADCRCFDYDHSGDVDLADFAALQEMFTAP